MKILLVGSGGREHALAWAISGSALLDELVIAPGSDAMSSLGRCVDCAVDDIDAIMALAQQMPADLVVIGPEVPLVLGLADKLEAAGIAAFGPSMAAARLEGSKGFAREVCERHNIPQAKFAIVDTIDAANLEIDQLGGVCVIKADGLAAGKGVVVADSAAEAKQAAAEMLGGRFGAASSEILVEERMVGPEASLFALVDGPDCLFMASAQDHKRAFDNDQGPNTGGMGAISPAPRLDDALRDRVMAEIVEPLARGMAEDGMPYRGVLYVGLMLTVDGPKVVEFNCRFGDPEAQVILPRLKTDLVAAMMATVEGGLGHFSMRWDTRSAVTVVMAAQGYPGDYEKGSGIRGLDGVGELEDTLVFHAGTKISADGTVTANGGRVLSVTGLGNTPTDARNAAYRAVDMIDWPEGFCRTDIAAH
ncbi:MAG: phosphoribosylamine--glycine ligase [Alphaproteobacteria bacterium]